MQILDEKTTGVQIIKESTQTSCSRNIRRKRRPCPLQRHRSDPLLFLAGSTLVSASICEYDIVGALRGAPGRVIKSDLTGLPLPATAELILEGEIEIPIPSKFQEEGPLENIPDDYSGKTGEMPKPVFYVKRILHRKNPTFGHLCGKPVTRYPYDQSVEPYVLSGQI